MSRAQEVRQKRLNERKEIDKKKAKQDAEVKAQKLFDWVLDMLENPTANNTADTVHLSDTDEGKIQVGFRDGKGLTDKPFESEVMELLADMFEKEEGYSGYYLFGRDCYSSVTIEIK